MRDNRYLIEQLKQLEQTMKNIEHCLDSMYDYDLEAFSVRYPFEKSFDEMIIDVELFVEAQKELLK